MNVLVRNSGVYEMTDRYIGGKPIYKNKHGYILQGYVLGWNIVGSSQMAYISHTTGKTKCIIFRATVYIATIPPDRYCEC